MKIGEVGAFAKEDYNKWGSKFAIFSSGQCGGCCQ